MKRTDRKSYCPINFSLETFGDPWSLLIVRDIVYFGKHAYKEFLASEERITTSVLADRLESLQSHGILTKTRHTADKRREIYTLTEEGLDLVPVLLEIANWGVRFNSGGTPPLDWIARVQSDRERMIRLVRETVRKGGSIFVGQNSVVEKLTTDRKVSRRVRASGAARRLRAHGAR